MEVVVFFFAKQKIGLGTVSKQRDPSSPAPGYQSIPYLQESLLILAADERSRGVSLRGRASEMNGWSEEMDDAMKRGQAPIDPRG